MRCCPALLDIIAALRADGLPGPALAGRVAYRCILAALGLALSVLLVSALFVSGLLVSALGSTTAGRSTYFGVSAASALFDTSVALAGAGAACVSLPPNDKLRSPAWAAAEAKTNPAIRMNLRMFVSPLVVEAETMPGRRFPDVRQVTQPRVLTVEGIFRRAGAANRTRTCDPVITNDVLYQLSYCGGPNAALGVSRKRPHLISGTAPIGKKNAGLETLVGTPA
jgi:hypothetical protein